MWVPYNLVSHVPHCERGSPPNARVPHGSTEKKSWVADGVDEQSKLGRNDSHSGSICFASHLVRADGVDRMGAVSEPSWTPRLVSCLRVGQLERW